MKKLLYIILLLNVCNLFAQHQTTLIVSQQQYANEALDLYIWSDAATPTPNEANTVEISVTDGWSAHQAVAITSTSSEFTDGAYSIQIEALVGSSDIGRLYFTCEIGATYRFTYSAKISAGAAGRMRQNSGWVTSPDNLYYTESWVEYTTDVEATATNPYFQFWATRTGNVGDKVYLDKITMIKL